MKGKTWAALNTRQHEDVRGSITGTGLGPLARLSWQCPMDGYTIISLSELIFYACRALTIRKVRRVKPVSSVGSI